MSVCMCACNCECVYTCEVVYVSMCMWLICVTAYNYAHVNVNDCACLHHPEGHGLLLQIVTGHERLQTVPIYEENARVSFS